MIRENCYRCDGWGYLHDENGHATLEGCPACKDRGYLVRWGASWAAIAEVCKLREEVSHQRETIRMQDERWDKAVSSLNEIEEIATSGDPSLTKILTVLVLRRA